MTRSRKTGNRGYASLRAAIESIAPKIGCVAATLLEWVNFVAPNTQIDYGACPGHTMNRTVLKRWSAKSKRCAGPTRS